MKQFFLFFLLLIVPIFLFAQNISVKSFRLLDNDLDALVKYPEIDRSNGEKAALIKIVTTETGFEFGGGQLGIVKVVQKTAEIWVYVPAKLKAITIAHPMLGQLPNKYYNFEIPIVSGKVYLMELVTGRLETIVKPTEIETQWLIINSEPTGADVYINDQPAGKTPYQNELPVGKYSWRVSKELYLTNAGVVELTTAAGKNKLDLKLKPNFGSISVKTTPEVNAKVFVNGMDVNKTTPCILEKIPTGDLTISAKTDFYSISPQNVKMTPEQNLQVSLTASPTFGSISVSTTPESGAAVTLNGMATGKTTPCTLERVPAGEHTINISREWFETTTRKVTLATGQNLPLAVGMNPTFAEVTINTDPVADVYINNQLKGNGTWKGRLTPGVYTFEGKLDKHTTAIEKQTVIVGIPLTLTLKPTPKTGTLKLVSNPFDATITLNGKEYGTTPNTIKNLLIGDYTLTLKKTGYGTVNKTITITLNTITEVNETLSVGIEVTIASTPAGAQLWVDEISAGSTPSTTTLGFGNHTIKLVNGKKIMRENITLTPEGKTKFEFNVSEVAQLRDIDGNIYNTVTIGSQVWMVENLKTTKYRNGDPIPMFTKDTQWGYSVWDDLTTGGYCNYNNDVNNVNDYGRLYNWYAVVDNRNLCPTGWHISTSDDWITLKKYLGGSRKAGEKLKEKGTAHWMNGNAGTNSSGFTALPSGLRFAAGSSLINYGGYWWTNSYSDEKNACIYSLIYKNNKLSFDYQRKSSGCSVRCVKDE